MLFTLLIKRRINPRHEDVLDTQHQGAKVFVPAVTYG